MAYVGIFKLQNYHSQTNELNWHAICSSHQISDKEIQNQTITLDIYIYMSYNKIIVYTYQYYNIICRIKTSTKPTLGIQIRYFTQYDVVKLNLIIQNHNYSFIIFQKEKITLRFYSYI